MKDRKGSGVLIVDIETFPVLGYTWGMYEQNVIKALHPTSLACFSAKWLRGDQITLGLADMPGYEPGSRDDKALCESLHRLLDDAEIVVAHNGDKFDIRKINARMVLNGLLPYSPIRTVDTYKQAKAIGGFDSNKLDYLGKHTGCGEKIQTGGFALWEGCLAGEEKAWRKMKRYNAQDVRLLEDIYLKLLPWMKNVASNSMAFECPRCHSMDLQARGYARNRTTRYQRFQCNNCGGWCRDTRAEKPAIGPYVAA